MRTDIIESLLADAGVGIPGQTLFIHQIPATMREGVMIKLPLEGFPVNGYLPGYFKGSFQVIVRAVTNAEGEAKCREVCKALVTARTKDYFDSPGQLAMRIDQLLLDRLPIRYPRQESNAIEWSINFTVVFVLPEAF